MEYVVFEIETTHCVLGERHPVPVPGLVVNRKCLLRQKTIPWLQVLRQESSFGAKAKSKTVGHPQRVPLKSGQPPEEARS